MGKKRGRGDRRADGSARVLTFGLTANGDWGSQIAFAVHAARFHQHGIALEPVSFADAGLVWVDGVGSLGSREVLAEAPRARGVIIGPGPVVRGGPLAVAGGEGARGIEGLLSGASLWLGAADLAERHGLPLVWSGASLPEPLPPLTALAARRAASLADLLALADRRSEERLRETGYDGEVTLVPDPLAGLAGLWPDGDLRQAAAVSIPGRPAPARRVVFCAERSGLAGDPAEVGRVLSDLCSRLDAALVLMALDPAAETVAALDAVAAKSTGTVHNLGKPASLTMVAAVLAGADVCVSTAAAGLIGACGLGTPSLLVAASIEGAVRGAGFLDQVGLGEEWVVADWGSAPARLAGLAAAPRDRFGGVPARVAAVLDRHVSAIVAALDTGPRRATAPDGTAFHVVADVVAERPWALPVLLDHLANVESDEPAPESTADVSGQLAIERARADDLGAELARAQAATEREAAARDHAEASLRESKALLALAWQQRDALLEERDQLARDLTIARAATELASGPVRPSAAPDGSAGRQAIESVVGRERDGTSPHARAGARDWPLPPGIGSARGDG